MSGTARTADRMRHGATAPYMHMYNMYMHMYMYMLCDMCACTAHATASLASRPRS